ncbi:uncharacterized protein LOC119066561 [Bradysia coprophila]|uniref:uncharacterized protein LOC119066561 n=1 Tax=Bradysia coprophila TaxID=38358 RepID=UPI00187DB0F2|nr:uncharacterized protein LOC119066561 [Bradysia coprophila]
MTDLSNCTILLPTCRLCMESTSETCALIPIYETNANFTGRYFNGFNENIPEIISLCVGIQIDPNDGLPTAICSSCQKSLISSHTFRQKCLKANTWLSQFKIKVENTDSEGHTIHDSVTAPSLEADTFEVNQVKEEDESTDHESESASSTNDLTFNSNQSQSMTATSQGGIINQSRNDLNLPEIDNESASKTCVICGLIVQRLHEHSNVQRNSTTSHINFPSATPRQNSSSATVDFLMCRMFHKNMRHFVKVKFPSSNGVRFNDFLRAASETFNFNPSSFDHFVDQDGYIIDSKDFMNVIASDAYRSGFAVGVVLRKDDVLMNGSPVDSVNQTTLTSPYRCVATIPLTCTTNVVTPAECVSTAVFTSTSTLSSSSVITDKVTSAENVTTPSQAYASISRINPVTAADLQAYLVKRKGSYLLQEYREKSMLSDKSRRFLINAAVDFLEENFGIYPKRIYKEELAHAIVELFPAYKTKNSSIGGIDLFLNGRTGYLNSRLKNLQNKRRSEEGTSDVSNGKKAKISMTFDDCPEENEIENDANVEENLKFLRSAVPSYQYDEIEFKLRSTLRRRIELTSNKPSVHLRSSFPFFFSDPSLISFDYKLRYPQFEENLQPVVAAIETNAFQILKSLKIEDNAYDDSDWPHIIQCFLCLLKLLPPTATGRYSKTRQSSDQRVSSFILFTRDHVSDRTLFENIDPFIVACGPNRSSIHKYFVVVDGCVIDVPAEWNFVDVFDLFFKVHFVFNVDYNNNLRTFLRFFEKFAYNHIGAKITNRIQEISTQLLHQHDELMAK